jgi:hypothetical protein
MAKAVTEIHIAFPALRFYCGQYPELDSQVSVAAEGAYLHADIRSRGPPASQVCEDATVGSAKRGAVKKGRGGALLSLFATPASPRQESERIWNADRRSFQPAALLARPRFQQEAHAYRRSTTALTQERSPPKGPTPGHVSWDTD